MQSHLDLDDDMFARQFAECTLDPKLFTHEAHLRLAWIHVNRYGLLQALENIRSQIANYDRIHGDGTKYHETLTVAAVYVVNHFINKSGAPTFSGFMSEFPRLTTRFRDLLSQHYSQDIMKNPIAKEQYLKPNILPFEEDS